MKENQKSAYKRMILHVLTFLFVVAAGTGLFVSLTGAALQNEIQSQDKIEVNVEKLANLTEDLKPNPHASHLGELECGECHQAQDRSEIICSQCHLSFDWYDQLLERNKK